MSRVLSRGAADLDARLGPIEEGPPAGRTAPAPAVDPDATKSWTRRAWPIVRAHRAIFSLSLAMSFLALLLQVQIPRLLGEAINESIVRHSVPVGHFAAILFALVALREVANYLSRRYLLETAYSIEFDLRTLMYEHLGRLSFGFYDRWQTGQLISRANSDIRAVQLYLAMAPTILVQLFVVVVAFFEMLTINVGLTLVTMATMPFTFAVGVAMRKKIFPVSWLIQSRLAEVATIVEENVSGVRVVKSFAAEGRELNSLARAADRLRWANVTDADIRATWAPTMENLPRAGLAVILLYGGLLAVHNYSMVGTIVAFNAYMVLFQPPFRQLGMVIMMGQRAKASAGRIYEVLDERPEVRERPGAVELGPGAGSVAFEDVSFAYGDGPAVLSHLDLVVEAGETLALVGPAGSGKSTMCRLVNRSYDVVTGSVRVAGSDVRDLTLASLRSRVGLVLDEPFLFSVSIRDNIAYGRPDATIEEVRAAAEAAQAAEFIDQLPGGYDTVVGERGYSLSGGQRQRVAIARALLVNPPVLILDDATSAVDVETEQKIHAALASLLAGRTTLVVAHRLSTIALADRVALVEDGAVRAVGTHAELLESTPRYAEVLAQADLGPEAPTEAVR